MKILVVIMVSLFSVFSLFSSARSLSDKVLAKASSIVYSYGNYTLPPEHRTPVRYTITADSVIVETTKNEVTTSVAYHITRQQFEQFKADLKKCAIKCRKHGRQSLACGGSSHFFGVYDADQNCIFDARGYMAGKMSGQLRYRYSPKDLFVQLVNECKAVSDGQ